MKKEITFGEATDQQIKTLFANLSIRIRTDKVTRGQRILLMRNRGYRGIAINGNKYFLSKSLSPEAQQAQEDATIESIEKKVWRLNHRYGFRKKW